MRKGDDAIKKQEIVEENKNRYAGYYKCIKTLQGNMDKRIQR